MELDLGSVKIFRTANQATHVVIHQNFSIHLSDYFILCSTRFVEFAERLTFNVNPKRSWLSGGFSKGVCIEMRRMDGAAEQPLIKRICRLGVICLELDLCV